MAISLKEQEIYTTAGFRNTGADVGSQSLPVTK